MTVKIEEFLTELLQKVKKGDLSDEMSSLLSQLFLKYEMEKNGFKMQDKIQTEDYMKYYTLGWYIYNAIENKA